MTTTISITLNTSTLEQLQLFANFEKQSIDHCISTALQSYFEQLQKKYIEESIKNEEAHTKLTFDEFWDGLDFD